MYALLLYRGKAIKDKIHFRRLIMKKFLTLMLTLVVALTACLGLTACSSAPTESGIADGKLTIGYTKYAPMNYFDDENQFVGFDTELAKAFCEEIGVTADFVEITWSNKFIDLESRTIDVIWNGMTITEEASQKTAVSSPYLTNKQVVVCKKTDASLFTDANSVKNAVSIAFEGGSAGQKVCEGLEIPEDKWVKQEAQKDTLLEVSAGTSQIAIIDVLMAQVLVGEGTDFSDLTFVDVGFETEDFGVAFRKSDLGLAKAFDLFVKMAKANGSFQTLQAKYFG